MNRLLFLTLIIVTGIAILSLREKKVKFEIEFEMEPKSGDDTED